jgi:hypothetical protein
MMNIFYKFILVFILLLFPQEQYPLKNGRPTTKGIDYYVQVNQYKLVDEFQTFIKDTLYNDVYMIAEDFTKHSDNDSTTLGLTEYQQSLASEILINDKGDFSGYDIASFSKTKIKKKEDYYQFVKSTIFHELTHVYIFQCILIMRSKNMYIDPEYNDVMRIYPSYEKKFGSDFIEEGICEYLVQKKGEIYPYEDLLIPVSKKELLDTKNLFLIQYKYSSFYLKEFLDTTGLKNGIFMLLSNKPPTYEEILKPALFYSRLK